MVLPDPAQGPRFDFELELGLETESPEEAERVIRERFFGNCADRAALEVPLPAERVNDG